MTAAEQWPNLCTFEVVGRPQPQGSARSFQIRKGGELTGKVATTSDNPSLAEWKQRVALAAADAHANRPLFTDPVRVDLRFYFTRPAGHFGTGRNANMLRRSAREAPSVAPDLDKLIRAVLDALTGVVWRDDAQVTSILAHKQYGPRAGVTVSAVQLVPAWRS